VNGPHPLSLDRWKYALETKLGIDNSLIAEKYIPNHKMLDRYYRNIHLPGETRIFGGLSLDFADFNPNSYYDEVNKVYHNYVLVPEGKFKG